MIKDLFKETIVITEAIPITIPKIVRPDLILLPASDQIVSLNKSFIIPIRNYKLNTNLRTFLLIRLSAGRDMFFSGHTGMPFLITLIFWQDKFVRYISLGAATIFGTAVLFGHLHYSIDVFAAFLITYSIFVICQKLFAKDYALINDDKEV